MGTKVLRQVKYSVDGSDVEGWGAMKALWKITENCRRAPGTGQKKENMSCLKGGVIFTSREKPRDKTESSDLNYHERSLW